MIICLNFVQVIGYFTLGQQITGEKGFTNSLDTSATRNNLDCFRGPKQDFQNSQKAVPIVHWHDTPCKKKEAFAFFASCLDFFLNLFTNGGYGWHQSWLVVLCQHYRMMLIHPDIDYRYFRQLGHTECFFRKHFIFSGKDNFRNEFIHQHILTSKAICSYSKRFSVVLYFCNEIVQKSSKENVTEEQIEVKSCNVLP